MIPSSYVPFFPPWHSLTVSKWLVYTWHCTQPTTALAPDVLFCSISMLFLVTGMVPPAFSLSIPVQLKNGGRKEIKRGLGERPGWQGSGFHFSIFKFFILPSFSSCNLSIRKALLTTFSGLNCFLLSALIAHHLCLSDTFIISYLLLLSFIYNSFSGPCMASAMCQALC